MANSLKIFFAMIAVIITATSVVGQTVEQGFTSLSNRDYDVAINNFKPLALDGNPQA